MRYFRSFLLIGFISLLACNKPNAPDCFQKSGKNILITRQFTENISKLVLYDYIQIELIPSENNYLEIIGPENLLPEIITEVIEPNIIEIRNDNTCNFVRDFKRKITIKVYMNISEIGNYSSGDVKSIHTINESYFKIDCFESSGQIDLDVNCDSLRVSVHDGVSDIKIEGNSELTYLFNAGLNYLDASALESTNTYVNSNSINETSTTVNGYFFVSINSTGSVYYRGTPNQIDLIQSGSGELIEQ